MAITVSEVNVTIINQQDGRVAFASCAEILPLSRPKLSELKVGKISFYPPMPIPAFR